MHKVHEAGADRPSLAVSPLAILEYHTDAMMTSAVGHGCSAGFVCGLEASVMESPHTSGKAWAEE